MQQIKKKKNSLPFVLLRDEQLLFLRSHRSSPAEVQVAFLCLNLLSSFLIPFVSKH